MPLRMHADEAEITEVLVSALISDQMPHLAGLALTIVEPWGTDNAIWRLGEGLVVRLPRIASAVDQVAFEEAWLGPLSKHVPVAVPEPVAVGEPGCGYPYPWALHRWLPGQGAGPATIMNPTPFALDLAELVTQLTQAPTAGAPVAKNRARPLRAYDNDSREMITSAQHLIDADAALAVWEEALAADVHPGNPVWVHGDLEGNCLVQDGRLSGLVDWGLACVGDPAVDVQVVWSPLFTAESRATFLTAVGADEATILRSRGAAVNQACGALPYYLNTYPLIVERSWHKLRALGIEALPTAQM